METETETETEMKEDRNEGPPRKRLLTDPNPKGSFVTASLESTVSSDSSSDRVAKKTRELPNLSDCHSCAVRINYTNPRERLQPLESMWRVVLLCRKCTKRMKSSELCPYCFTDVSDEKDCFKCLDCQHSIHKDCVTKYGSGLGFSVCVDCWVPDAVANTIRARKRKSKKKNKESCQRAATIPGSRVSVQETNDPRVLGEEMEPKVAAAAKTSGNAPRKAVVAKNAVELGQGLLTAVASKNGAENSETKAVDDVALAFMLHRAMNSSPRISRYGCMMSSCNKDSAQIACYSRRRASKKTILMNSSNLDVPLICYSRRSRKGGLRNSASLDAPLVCYSRRGSGSRACSHVRECECFICKLSERIDEHVSLSSAFNRGSNAEKSLNGNHCKESDGETFDQNPQQCLLKYHRIGKGTSRPSIFAKDLDLDSSMDSMSVGNGNEYHEISENCNETSNRFLLKYKRSLKSKPEFSCKVEEFSPLSPSNNPMESTSLSDTRFQSSYNPTCLVRSQGKL